MVSFAALPQTLLLLLLTSPFLATSAVLASSRNDPFRAIVLVHRKHQPELPLCCLKQPPSTEPPSDVEDVLLSFEEWKSKQFQTQSQSQSQPHPQATNNDALEHLELSTTHELDVSLPDPSTYPHETELSPHFRVPIIDRFNYANLDCSARVHTSHRSAKSPSSILSSKKDKYMLSPCSSGKGEEQFVVVELCEDIRIDTVQLANFEFFSGVFKDFSVKVAKTYTTSDEGWVLAGTYRGKNVRGVQSFHTPTTLRDFYRYIRIDFHSHYGHEYYCPISLLRVYGLTHLEQYKWDIWEAESHTRSHAQVKDFPSVSEHLPTSSGASELSKYMDELRAHDIPTSIYLDTAPPIATTQPPVRADLNISRVTKAKNHTSSSISSSSEVNGRHSAQSSPITPDVTESASSQQITTTASSSPQLSERRSATSSLNSTITPILPNESQSTHSDLASSEYTSHVQISMSQSSLPTHHTQATNVVSTAHATFSNAPPIGSRGESIYGTIMTRLTLLEANHSLYVRYVEEQTAGVREVLRRLGEDIGRLESISRIQAQMYQRTVHEWERQRLRLEFEHGELLSRVNHLADEVIMEKRLGIAQLCLLLAVLVFMGLTRGASSIVQPHLINHSAREGGHRNMSFAGSNGERGWNPPGRRSRSPPYVLIGKKPEKDRHPSNMESRVEFPVHRSRRSSNHDHTPRRLPHLTSFVDKRFTPRASTAKPSGTLTSYVFRTPTRRAPPSTSLDVSTLPRPHMVRTNSHSSVGLIIPKATKRLARTSHLHEVKGSLSRGQSQAGQENGDVFSASPIKKHHYSRRLSSPRRPLSPLDLSRQPKDMMSEDTTDADAWIDTDAEGGSECSEFAAVDPSL